MTSMTTVPMLVSLDAWPGVVLGVSPEGEIVASNGRLEGLIGVDVVGRAVVDLLDAESSRRKWERIVAAGGESPRGWELIFHGAARLLEPRTFSVMQSGDAPAPTLWLVEHPVDRRLDAMSGQLEVMNAELTTTQRALVKEQGRLAAALKELERSNAALDEFAHAASHDLKAPLRAIIDYAELLQDETRDLLPAEPRSYLARVAFLSAKMRRMIDAVLEYARAGRASGSVERTDTGVAMRELVEFLAPPADVAVEIDATLPTLDVERVPFDQVFRNLISNAIKYRRPEGARVRVSAKAEGDCWRFTVADNGPGIVASQHERIWRLFQTTRPEDGTGIGLAVVKRIVDAQGGRVYVESVPGDGARFHVLWPSRPRGAEQGVKRDA